MNFLDDINEVEELEEMEEMEEIINVPQPRRPRFLRQRRDLFTEFQERDAFRKRYRVYPEVAENLLQKIEGHLPNHWNYKNNPVSKMNRLLICLRFYATGSFQIVLGDVAWLHKSTVSRIVKSVSHAIALLRPEYIKMPSNPEEEQRTKLGFYELIKPPNMPLPGVIGALDCSHVPIKSPGGQNAELFRNRKGYFSINVQAVCDAQLKFTNIVARWYGSAHDSVIFLNSNLNAQLSNNQFTGFLVADGGYACSRTVLTCVRRPQTPGERRYNRSQIRSRNPIERSFGLWKKRFPAVGTMLRTKLQTSLAIIVATAVVHNICLLSGDNDPPPVERDVQRLIRAELQVNLDQDNPDNAVNRGAAARRNAIIRSVFDN